MKLKKKPNLMSIPRLMPLSIIAVVCVAALVFFLPLFWTFVWATWTNEGIFSMPPKFTFGSDLQSNLTGFNENINLWRSLLNTFIVAGVSTFSAIIFCTAAGYALAKHSFAGRNATLMMILVTMAVPAHITLIPLFSALSSVGLANTYAGLVIPFLAPALGVFFMRQSIEAAIPDEVLDAARLDGASELRIVFQVVAPMSAPNIAALTILLFSKDWGALFWPLIMARTPDMFTLPVAVAAIAGQYEQPYGQAMLGASLSMLVPLMMFLALQKYFTKGLNVGGLK